MIRAAAIFSFLLMVTGMFPQEIDLEDGLVLYLPFNGNTLDESGNNVPTNPVNGPVLIHDRHGNEEQALKFDGVNDHITINNNLPIISGQQFTICMWIQIDGSSMATHEPRSNSLFEQLDQDSKDPVYIHFNGELEEESYISLGSSTGKKTTVRVDAPDYHYWNHILCMLDDNHFVSIYINGKLKARSLYINDGDFSSGVTSVKLGSYTPFNESFGAFNGIMDEVYIFDRALNQCEIEALYSGYLLEER